MGSHRLNHALRRAALLCSMGEQEITAANIEKILSSVGVEADKEKLNIVVNACKGKSTDELVAQGTPLLASIGGGGGAAAPAAAAAEVVRLLLLLLRPRRRKRKKSPKRKMTTWASVCSTSLYLSLHDCCFPFDLS